MNSLIIDSATKTLYIAIVSDDKLVFESYLEGRNDHAKNIVKTIEDGLKASKLDVNDLNEVVVGVGPGSYTGCRMAVTVGKMFTMMPNLKLCKVSTLKLISSSKKGVVLSRISAKHDNYFASIYDTNKNEFVLNEGFYNLEEINKYQYTEDVTDEEFKVDYKEVLKAKEEVVNPDLLVPNYLRDTEAERNLNDKKI
ncbi:MAG: tRNA (adenosine(37)-N6)-threonylcarbamoyltransferase complex dimerization subunit type 1 TsaB [Acholeplasmatales bacterium]|nr:tRNA (adenosine(37)-N6)-threonylcarbamoyltransferase complex dimerization subunit type 1 TsaB [Acholeplasmatales bacterium]